MCALPVSIKIPHFYLHNHFSFRSDKFKRININNILSNYSFLPQCYADQIVGVDSLAPDKLLEPEILLNDDIPQQILF